MYAEQICSKCSFFFSLNYKLTFKFFVHANALVTIAWIGIIVYSGNASNGHSVKCKYDVYLFRIALVRSKNLNSFFSKLCST